MKIFPLCIGDCKFANFWSWRETKMYWSFLWTRALHFRGVFRVGVSQYPSKISKRSHVNRITKASFTIGFATVMDFLLFWWKLTEKNPRSLTLCHFFVNKYTSYTFLDARNESVGRFYIDLGGVCFFLRPNSRRDRGYSTPMGCGIRSRSLVNIPPLRNSLFEVPDL